MHIETHKIRTAPNVQVKGRGNRVPVSEANDLNRLLGSGAKSDAVNGYREIGFAGPDAQARTACRLNTANVPTRIMFGRKHPGTKFVRQPKAALGREPVRA